MEYDLAATQSLRHYALKSIFHNPLGTEEAPGAASVTVNVLNLASITGEVFVDVN